MEQKNYYQKAETTIKELESRVQGLFSEVSYLKMHNSTGNELTFTNSCGLLLTRLSSVTDQVQKVLSLNVDMLKEIKFPKDDLTVLRRQYDEANTKLIQLSTALSNACYFLKQNITE